MTPEPNSPPPQRQRPEIAASETMGEVVPCLENDSRVNDEPGGSPPAVDGECVLVPIGDDGSWLVFGNAPPGEELLPLELVPERDRTTLGNAVALSVGLANTAAQIGQGISEAKGLVRLAPETLSQLKAGATPMTSNGWNLGLLTKNGQITKSVRWLPAGSGQALSLLATIGPAASLVAIQWQLASISRMVEKNISFTKDVLHAVQWDQWAEVDSHYRAVMAAVREAQEVGQVTDDIWGHLQDQGSYTIFGKAGTHFMDAVMSHQKTLSGLTSASDRHEWITENTDTVVGDIEALWMAERGWILYHAMRMGHLVELARHGEDTRKHIEVLQEQIDERYGRVLATSQPLLIQIYRQLRLVELSPGGVGMKVFARRKTRLEVRQHARSVADRIRLLTGDLPEYEARPASGDNPLSFGTPDAEVRRRLDCLLEPTEELDCLVLATTDEPMFQIRGREVRDIRKTYVAFTDRRVLFMRYRPLISEARIEGEIPISKITSILQQDSLNQSLESDLILETLTDRHRVKLTVAERPQQLEQMVSAIKRRMEDAAPAQLEDADGNQLALEAP